MCCRTRGHGCQLARPWEHGIWTVPCHHGEIEDDGETLPGRGSRSSFVLKIVCGFGIGSVCALLITTLVNSIL